MTTIEALKKKHNRATNVRKGLNALAFLAPMTTAVPTAITDAGGALKEIPADFMPLGLITTDGERPLDLVRERGGSDFGW